jgi:Ser/Thr protein kinase RdoA (MazF antagonist)
MRAFESLNMRGQLGRLRRLAAVALQRYDIPVARLVPLAHEENTTFRVDAETGDRYVVRIHRVDGSPIHAPRSEAEVRSELVWLTALRRDTDLAVPQPVATTDGSSLTIAHVGGVPEPRICVVFRWGSGRFVDARLTASHLERVGIFIARLHEHVRGFTPPEGFERWWVGDVSGGSTDYVREALHEPFGNTAPTVADEVMAIVRSTRDELGSGSDVFGLIHGDLHQDNFLFDRGNVRAIDFDDCGWGHFVADLGTTLSELRARPDYDALREGLLRGYRSVRTLPAEHERHLDAFHAQRLLLLTVWCVEQRNHPGFLNWEAEARDGIAEMQELVRRLS